MVKILSFGEVLWDVFGDEKKIGGAPFNFAAFCVKAGVKTDLVSAVGKDEPADETVSAVGKLGVGTQLIAHTDYPTGYCKVTLSNGVPSYCLVPDTAYDNITVDFSKLNPDEYSYLYCGTLALRSKVSFDTFRKLSEKFNGKIICDVNIRQSFYSSSLLRWLFSVSSVIKISREELPAVSECLGYSKDILNFTDSFLAEYKNIDTILITLDKDGAALYRRGCNPVLSKKPQNKVVSTVGAGDSFFATYICSRLNGNSPEISLEKAVSVSDLVVTYREAIPDIQI